MLKLGKRIKAARERAGYTQEEVAETVGVSRTAIARWEKGEIGPKVENLVTVAEKLGVSADYLLGLDSDTTSKGLGLSKKAEAALKEFLFEVRNDRNDLPANSRTSHKVH